MAVAAQRQVQVAQNGGITAAKVTETVVDQRTGLVAQKETIAYEVPNQSGGTTVMLAERVRAARIPAWIHSSTRESNYRQLESGGGGYRGSGTSQLGTAGTVQDTEEPKGSFLDLICLPFFAPCAFHLCFVLFWLCTFGISTLVLIGLTAGGPLQCDHDDIVYNIGIATLLLLLSFLILMVLCCCYGCFNHNKKPSEANSVLNGTIYCLCILTALAFIAFFIWGSVAVFANLSDQTSHDSDSANDYNDCNGLSVVPIVSISFVYAGSLLFWCCCMCCCCMCLKAIGET